MSFLTLEDVNTANLDYINEYYELDTSKIGTEEFENVVFDFCVVSHSISGSEHTFTFDVYNTLWTGAYWLSKSNGTYINSDADVSSNTISFVTTESSVKLHLYLCSFAPEFTVMRLEYILKTNEPTIVSKNRISTLQGYVFKSLHDGTETTHNISLVEGVKTWHS